MNEGNSVTLFKDSEGFSENNKLNTGIRRVKFKRPKIMLSIAKIIYGIANFSIGLAKERSLRYIFMILISKLKYKTSTKLLNYIHFNEGDPSGGL